MFPLGDGSMVRLTADTKTGFGTLIRKVFLSALVLVSTFAHSQSLYAKFPGKPSALPSPDGRYVLRNVDSPKGPGPYHTIYLEDRHTGKKRKVYEYERSASVVWAPDSRRFAVNDYLGSNVSEAYIYSVDGRVSRIDVQDEIVRKVGSFRHYQWDHDYFGVFR
jgi:hypothetical protein